MSNNNEKKNIIFGYENRGIDQKNVNIYKLSLRVNYKSLLEITKKSYSYCSLKTIYV